MRCPFFNPFLIFLKKNQKYFANNEIKFADKENSITFAITNTTKLIKN